MNLTFNFDSKDLSREWKDYSGPGHEITIASGKKIFIGYHKPIDSVYVEIFNSITTETILKVEVDKASGASEVEVYDETYGLDKSGVVSWKYDKKLHVPVLRFGKALYWYQLSLDVDSQPRKIIGINTIFSYDSDLREEQPNIIDFLPEGATSFIMFHMSSRKEIVQILRKKFLTESKLLDQFDLLNIEEVHQASKYLTLSKIFFSLSGGAQDDKWGIKSKEFYNTFTDFIDATTLSVDKNDNGIADPAESNAIQSIRIIRE